MSEVPYYRLKQLVKLSKVLTYYDKKEKYEKSCFVEKRCSFAGKAAVLRFFSETKVIALY